MLAKVTGKIASALNTDPLAGYELGVRKFRGGRHNLVHIQDAVEISSNRPVSVVSIEVKDVVARCASAEESQLVLDSFKAGVTLLTKLRHPAILQVVKPLVEGKTRRRFVTERISSLVSLELSCGSLSKQEKILGLLNCSKAIEFMHQSVGYLLLDFSPSAICIVEGKWKIFDLSQAVSIERADDIKCGCPLTSIAAPMLDYCSTEVVDALSPKQMEIDDLFVTGGNKSVKAPDSDVFSFVIVCAEVLSGRKAFNCGNDATLRQRQYLSVELEVSKWFSGRPLSSPRPSLSALRKDTCFVSSDVLLLTTLEEYDLLTDEQRFSTLKGIYDGLGRSAFDEAVIVRLIIPLMCREAMQESRRRYAVPILMQCCGCLSEQTFAGFLREYIIGLLRAVIAADNLSRCLDVAEVVLGKFDLLSKHFRTDDERNTILLPFLERCVDPAVDGTNVVRMAVDCISQFTQSYGNLRFSDGLPSRLIKIASSCKKNTTSLFHCLECVLKYVSLDALKETETSLVQYISSPSLEDDGDYTTTMQALTILERVYAELPREHKALFSIPLLSPLLISTLSEVSSFSRRSIERMVADVTIRSDVPSSFANRAPVMPVSNQPPQEFDTFLFGDIARKTSAF